MTASLAAALVSGVAAGLIVGTCTVWLASRVRRGHSAPAATAESTEARLARDFTVLAELLSERLAKIWLADTPGAPAAEGDAHYHHVLESTTTIVRQAGASPKAATAVGALTAKRVRPGPIRGRRDDGSPVGPPA
ncbi:MAG: hypothetical protein OXG33_06050 [Chloroflexi bacterium]|nr:hypothetical protein [Chloroflexota bacterium]